MRLFFSHAFYMLFRSVLVFLCGFLQMCWLICLRLRLLNYSFSLSAVFCVELSTLIFFSRHIGKKEKLISLVLSSGNMCIWYFRSQHKRSKPKKKNISLHFVKYYWRVQVLSPKWSWTWRKQFEIEPQFFEEKTVLQKRTRNKYEKQSDRY